MARSTIRSNQKPDTLMQDRISQDRRKPLASHGRTIHGVKSSGSGLSNAWALYPQHPSKQTLDERSHLAPSRLYPDFGRSTDNNDPVPNFTRLHPGRRQPRKCCGDNRYAHRDATMVLIAFRHALRASELCDLRAICIEPNPAQWSILDPSAAAGACSLPRRAGFQWVQVPPGDAPARSSRSSYGGDEMAEAFGKRVTHW
jgi:hypothetical protein